MNLDRNYSHQSTFPLNTTVHFPLADHHPVLSPQCDSCTLASSYFYYYHQESGEDNPWMETLNQPVEEPMETAVLREIVHLVGLGDADAPTTVGLRKTTCSLGKAFENAELLVCWLEDKGSNEETIAAWSRLSEHICRHAPRPTVLLLPHDRFHYLSARLLFTAQFFYQKLRLVKLHALPQWRNVTRCFVFYSSVATPVSEESHRQVAEYDWLIPPSNDFLVKVEFTFLQMVANECYFLEQCRSELPDLRERCQTWMESRQQRWNKIKAETRPVEIFEEEQS